MKTILFFSCFCVLSCSHDVHEAVSASGVAKTTASVQVGPDGLTVEQRNIKGRLERDNQIGSIKHLYVISTISGQVLLYSTVKGKVTSGSKRLTPNTVVNSTGDDWYHGGFSLDIGGHQQVTTEVLGDDGTYGSSAEYLYWFDTHDVYHQHYIGGDQMIHVSDQPIAVKSVVINLETQAVGPPAGTPP